MEQEDVIRLRDDLSSRITRHIQNLLGEWQTFPPDEILNALGKVRGQVIRDYMSDHADPTEIALESSLPPDQYLPTDEDEEDDE